MRTFIRLALLLFLCTPALGWGKTGHEIVNRLAIRALPAELRAFYQKHERDVVTKSMEPDEAKRRTGAESVYHFVDLDLFGDPKAYPRSIDEGCRKHGFDAFLRAGLLPWRVRDMVEQLAAAWKAKDVAKIVELSAWLGHYAGDAHVPLHATANYDGQLTGQDGLHGRFEEELLVRGDFEKPAAALLGEAKEVDDPFEATFTVVRDSLSCCDAVLKADQEATAKEPLLKKGADGKYPRQRSEAYYKEMHEKLHVLAEQRLAKAATWAASLWLTAWKRAGEPKCE